MVINLSCEVFERSWGRKLVSILGTFFIFPKLLRVAAATPYQPVTTREADGEEFQCLTAVRLAFGLSVEGHLG
jgi:hypothetical protein